MEGETLITLYLILIAFWCILVPILVFIGAVWFCIEIKNAMKKEIPDYGEIE